MYIIKDVDENIKTDLLVKSNINFPPFFYKKIIFKPLTNLLVKEAGSPFNSLINFLGQVSHNPKDIPFDIYRTDFTLKQFLLIHPLTTVRKAKPEMTLKLQLPYTPIPTENEISKRKYLLIPVIKNRKAIYSLKFLKKKVRINIYAYRFIGNL